jgi:hypothetical protein
LIWLAIGSWMFFSGAFLGVLRGMLAEMFAARLRYS